MLLAIFLPFMICLGGSRDSDVDEVLSRTQEHIWGGSRFHVTVNDTSEDKDDPLQPPLQHSTQSTFPYRMPSRDESDDSETDSDDEFEAISVWDQLGESLVRAGIVSGAWYHRQLYSRSVLLTQAHVL